MDSDFIAKVLKEVVEGVEKAKADGVPAALPLVVTFEFDNVAFEVPLVQAYIQDGYMVSYSHASAKKN